MNIVPHSTIPVYSLPGLQHQTITTKSDGTHAMEAWKQTVAPGAAIPHHFHECEEVIYILQGMGEIAIQDKTVPFAADCTLIFPPRLAHQITNTGAETVRLVRLAFGKSGRRVSALGRTAGTSLGLPGRLTRHVPAGGCAWGHAFLEGRVATLSGSRHCIPRADI